MTSPADLSAQQVQEENQALTDEQRNMVKMALAEEAQLAAQAQLPQVSATEETLTGAGKTLSSAAKGAQIGAALGTIVPGVGNVIGGTLGAVGGLIGGAAVRAAQKKRGY